MLALSVQHQLVSSRPFNTYRVSILKTPYEIVATCRA